MRYRMLQSQCKLAKRRESHCSDWIMDNWDCRLLSNYKRKHTHTSQIRLATHNSCYIIHYRRNSGGVFFFSIRCKVFAEIKIPNIWHSVTLYLNEKLEENNRYTGARSRPLKQFTFTQLQRHNRTGTMGTAKVKKTTHARERSRIFFKKGEWEVAQNRFIMKW